VPRIRVLYYNCYRNGTVLVSTLKNRLVFLHPKIYYTIYHFLKPTAWLLQDYVYRQISAQAAEQKHDFLTRGGLRQAGGTAQFGSDVASSAASWPRHGEVSFGGGKSRGAGRGIERDPGLGRRLS